jgi:hypothetical protein
MKGYKRPLSLDGEDVGEEINKRRIIKTDVIVGIPPPLATSTSSNSGYSPALYWDNFPANQVEPWQSKSNQIDQPNLNMEENQEAFEKFLQTQVDLNKEELGKNILNNKRYKRHGQMLETWNGYSNGGPGQDFQDFGDDAFTEYNLLDEDDSEGEDGTDNENESGYGSEYKNGGDSGYESSDGNSV